MSVMLVNVLVLGARLEITGEQASIVFNAHGENRPLTMDAQNGELNVSGVLAADDVVTMSGANFNEMVATIANLSATIYELQARISNVERYTGMLPPPMLPPSPGPPPPSWALSASTNSNGDCTLHRFPGRGPHV